MRTPASARSRRSASFPPGLAVLPVVRASVAAHLATTGTWRHSAFADLARELLGHVDALEAARWCHETCYAVTKDGNEHRFFSAWMGPPASCSSEVSSRERAE